MSKNTRLDEQSFRYQDLKQESNSSSDGNTDVKGRPDWPLNAATSTSVPSPMDVEHVSSIESTNRSPEGDEAAVMMEPISQAEYPEPESPPVTSTNIRCSTCE